MDSVPPIDLWSIISLPSLVLWSMVSLPPLVLWSLVSVPTPVLWSMGLLLLLFCGSWFLPFFISLVHSVLFFFYFHGFCFIMMSLHRKKGWFLSSSYSVVHGLCRLSYGSWFLCFLPPLVLWSMVSLHCYDDHGFCFSFVLQSMVLYLLLFCRNHPSSSIFSLLGASFLCCYFLAPPLSYMNPHYSVPTVYMHAW